MVHDHRQLDLFVALPGDLPWRDDREAMSLPMVALGKRKRVRPIEWESPDGARRVLITAPAETGIATIWDFDVILWAISQLNEAVERGIDPSPAIHVAPYDLLRTIGRDVGGQNYKDLKAALNRLAGTYIRTTLRRDKGCLETGFHWLERWEIEADPGGRVRGMTITLPDWIYRGVVDERAVLAIPPEYFDIGSGLGRWLYRLARRHAGKQPAGWQFRVRHLWERSGSTQPYGQFARDLRRVIARNDLPEYQLNLVEGSNDEPVLSMIRDPMRVGQIQRRDLARMIKAAPVG